MMKYLPYLSAAMWPFSASFGYISWSNGSWITTALCVIVSALAIHSVIIAVHEAAHYGISKNRYWNDMVGVAAGTLTLSPMSLYRMLHRHHHGLLGTERDLEFWPYVNKGVSRRMRTLSVIVELTMASPYFIAMFTRSLIVGEMSDKVRRRCWTEFVTAVIFAVGLLVVVAINGWWTFYIIGYLLPIQIAGLLVSWRRMVEHMGLCHSDRDRMTRLVIPSNPVEQFICHMFFNEPYHAAHHKEMSAEWTSLPQLSEEMLAKNPSLSELHYASYFSAIPDMLKHLSDPRIGKHWLDA